MCREKVGAKRRLRQSSTWAWLVRKVQLAEEVSDLEFAIACIRESPYKESAKLISCLLYRVMKFVCRGNNG